MSSRSDIVAYQESLKRLMFGQGRHFTDLALHFGVSLSTAKRLLNGDDLSFEKVFDLCDWLGISFRQLVEMTSRATVQWQYLTLEQESFLAKRPGHFRFLRLLQRGQRIADIAREHRLSEGTVEAYLADFEAYGFLARQGKRAGSALRLLVPARVDWIERGPMWRTYFKRMVDAFTGHFFDGDREEKSQFIEYGQRLLSKESYRRFTKELDELYKKYVIVSEMEERGSKAETLLPMTCLVMVDQYRGDWMSDVPLDKKGALQDVVWVNRSPY
jgi:transcriptional regulator with XRE-family HTH domain